MPRKKSKPEIPDMRVHITMRPALYRKITKTTKKLGITMTEFGRRALIKYLKDEFNI